MTRMIPPLVHPTVRSAAERKLFEVIQDAPGTEDWVCLHSLALARHDAKRRGEVDFLLLTRKGVFVLEVKGGRVARQGGVWVFTNRWGDQERKYESPYQQASSAMFSLEKDLQSKFGKDHRLAKLLFGYGVLFPDIVFEDHGTEGDPAITYDLRDRSSFATFVERMARYSREQDPSLRYAPTEKDIRDLTDFLRGDFDRVPPLGARLDEATGRLLELTREQYHVLDAYASPAFPRLVIQGGAGTGKTLLAVECAIREARRSPGQTLFLCYNRLLAAYVSRVVRERDAQERVKVWSVYALLNRIIKNSRTFGPEFARRREGQPDEVVYGVLYPEYAGLAVMEGGAERYDTLVVDEGQDFLSQPLLAVLDGLLASGIEGGRWRVFCDVNNQGAVYGRYEEAAFAELLRLGHAMVLPVNRRNTKEIAQETTMLAVPRVPSVGVTPGVPVEYVWYDAPADQPRRLKNLLYRLYQDGVTAGRITVLTPRSLGNSCLPAVLDPLLEPVTEQNVYDVATGAHGSTTYSTVSAFKGLENDIVVLADVENLDGDWWRSVIYVGMSRARAGLYVLVPTSLRPTYEACLRRSLEAALS